MEIAVFTDEIDSDLVHALDVMAEYDVHTAEIRTVGGKNISDMSESEVMAIRKVLDQKGAKTCVVSSPIFKCDLPGTGAGAIGPLHGGSKVGFEGQTELLQNCIRAAKILDAKIIRTFTFWRYGTMTPDIRERIVGSYELPARMAQDAGIILAIEDEPSCYVGTGAETADIVSRIDSPAVKIVWDPANAIWGGETAYPCGYEACKGNIVHVHVKDARLKDNGEMETVRVGAGLVNWPAQFASLRADGYDDYLSIETHYRIDGNAEAATRESLAALKEITGL